MLNRFSQYPELFPRPVEPGELRQWRAKSAIQQQPAGRGRHIHVAQGISASERLGDRLWLSREPERGRIKLLRHQSPAALPEQIALSLRAGGVHGVAVGSEQLDALGGLGERGGIDASALRLRG